MRTLGLVVLAAAGAYLSTGMAAAAGRPRGLVLEQQTKHSFRSMIGMVTQDDTTTVYLSPTGVRIGAAGAAAPKFITLFRFQPKGRVVRIEVNGFKKTYVEEDLAERAARNEAMRKAIEGRLEKMREGGGPGGMLGGLAGLAGGPAGGPEQSSSPVVTKKTGDVKSIAGRRCRRFEFLQDGEKVFEGWYTERAAFPWVRRFDLEEGPGASRAALMAARRSQPGMELKSILYLPAGGRREVVTTRITEKPIPASTFRPPAGHRKVTPGAPRK